MFRALQSATVIALALLAAQPTQAEPPRADGAQAQCRGCRTGIASWYGPRHHGRLTANGERFDRNAMTAAHPTLPMNTRVRVVNLRNSRSVVVRVNDRGPGSGRMIDLSEAAARELGMVDRGLARVRIERLSTDVASAAQRARSDRHD